MNEVIEVDLPKIIVTRVNPITPYIRLTPFDYLVATSKVTGIPVEAMRCRSRLRSVAYAKHLYFYIARSQEINIHGETAPTYTLSDIAVELNMDHATVIYGHNKIAGWLQIPRYAKEFQPLIDEIIRTVNK